jgi:hypothetical protein
MNREQRRAAKLPSAREIERLGLRVETSGCDRCHATIGNLAAYFMCRIPGGKFEVRCPDCRTAGGAKPVLGGVCIGGGAEPWSKADRAWFAANPKRTWRLREPFPGEIRILEATGESVDGAFDRAAWNGRAARFGLREAIAVHQIQPGARARLLAAVPPGEALDSYTEAGIVRLTPGGEASAKLTGEDAVRLHAASQDRLAKSVVDALKAAGCGSVR